MNSRASECTRTCRFVIKITLPKREIPTLGFSPEPKSYLHVSLNRFIWLEVVKLIIYMSNSNSRPITNISTSHLDDSDSIDCDYASLKLLQTHRQCFSATSSSLTGSASSQSKIVSRSLPLKSKQHCWPAPECLLLKVFFSNCKLMVLVMDIQVLVMDIQVLVMDIQVFVMDIHVLVVTGPFHGHTGPCHGHTGTCHDIQVIVMT